MRPVKDSPSPPTLSKSLVLPDWRRVTPSEAPITLCGQSMPSGGPAFERKTKKWLLRIIQSRMVTRARSVLETGEAVTVAVGTPGCGKTPGGLFFSWELLASGEYRFVIWVVPNATLQKQLCGDRRDGTLGDVQKFLGTSFRLEAGENKKDTVNPADPFCLGSCVTYSMLNQPGAAELWIDRIKKWCEVAKQLGRSCKVLIVWDECHHLADTSKQFMVIDPTDPQYAEAPKGRSFRPWCAIAHKFHKAFVVDAGGHSLLLTGTPDRDDQCAIPLATYCQNHDPDGNEACAGTVKASGGGLVAETDVKDEDGNERKKVVLHVHVECTFEEAYEEGSLKMVELLPCPAKSTWLEKDSPERTVRTDADGLNDDDASASLRTALSIEGYRQAVAREAVDHWRDHKSRTFDFWLMLAICDNQKSAAMLAVYMKQTLGMTVGLAISGGSEGNGEEAVRIWEASGEEFEDGRKVLEKFKKGHYDVLVTVAMAYEGYDVPRISHLVLLTDKRTFGYVIQAVMRGARACPEATRMGLIAQKQVCFVNTPDDERIRSHVAGLESSLVKLGHIDYLEEPQEGGGGRRVPRITPVAAELVTPTPRKPRAKKQQAAESDDRYAKDLKAWTKKAPGLVTMLNRRFPGWRTFTGAKAHNVWAFVKEFLGR